jgi:DNA-binding PadR family transcriptional regulator
MHFHSHHHDHQGRGPRGMRGGAEALRDCMRRHGRRGEDDAFGDDGAFGFGGRHGRGPGRGRVFGHGDLRLVLLSLIAEHPRHGYELIRTIEEMFEGTYAPSPGAVYPTLTLLEEMGHARAEDGEGGRRRYAITPEGQAFLEDNREAVEAVMDRMQNAARAMARMRAPMAMRRAMHGLRQAMLERREHWGPGEAERVRAILERAAAEIRGDA